MGIAQKLSALTLREMVHGALRRMGIHGTEAVARFLDDHFTDHSQRLTRALGTANNRAWKALEIALAGESFWGRLDRTEDREFRGQVRAFLDGAALPVLEGGAVDFRQGCLRELRAARTAGHLSAAPEVNGLAAELKDWARFTDPVALTEYERQRVAGLGQELAALDYPHLARLLELRPTQGQPLLLVAVRYFFRRAVEEDAKLFQGLAWTQWETLAQDQQQGFDGLALLFERHGERMEHLLGDVRLTVLDIQEEQRRQSGQLQELIQGVQQVLERRDLGRREVRPGDSLSFRDDGERELVRRLVARYRALPHEQRRDLPALLNAIGKLEVVAGEFDAAQRDFQSVASLVADPTAQAEAHHNAYQAALERRRWDEALAALRQAFTLDPRRFTPFPLDKYEPQAILGAGGFGVAFRCQHRYLNAPVVVKTLSGSGLEQDVERVFTEARLLRRLDHAAIIRVQDCGYADAAERARPYLVMDYFEGLTLEEHVQRHGSLSSADCVSMARQVAEALQAAHGQGILHRDVKPANILVRKGEPGASATGGWHVKLIDFGLALKHDVLQAAAKPNHGDRTLVGATIAGTVDYAAPEQLGRAPGVAVGPHSDVFGFGKTCYYALLRTPDPDDAEKEHLPEPWRKLLSQCTARSVSRRPAGFGPILEQLKLQPTPGNTTTSGSTNVPPEVAQAIFEHPEVKAAFAQMSQWAPGSQPAHAEKPSFWSRLFGFGRSTQSSRDPARAQPLLQRAAAHHERGHYDWAIADCNEALKLDPESGAAYRIRAFAHHMKGEYDRAFADYASALRFEPNDMWVYLNRGRLYLWALNDDDRAIADLTQAIQIDPADGSAYRDRGYAYSFKGQDDLAIADFEERVRRQPSAESYYDLGSGWMLKDPRQCIIHLTRSLELDPNYSASWHNRGAAQIHAGDFDAAVADLTEAIRRESASRDANLYKAYYDRGWGHFRKNDLERAIADFGDCIRCKPNDAAAFTNRGRARLQAGDTEGAIADVTESLRLNPGEAGLTNRDWYIYEKGEFDRAAGDLTTAIRVQALRVRAHAYLLRGDKERAAADYEEELRLFPDKAGTCVRIAETLARFIDFAAAAQWQQRAIDLASPERRQELRARLEQYQAGSPDWSHV